MNNDKELGSKLGSIGKDANLSRQLDEVLKLLLDRMKMEIRINHTNLLSLQQLGTQLSDIQHVLKEKLQAQLNDTNTSVYGSAKLEAMISYITNLEELSKETVNKPTEERTTAERQKYKDLSKKYLETIGNLDKKESEEAELSNAPKTKLLYSYNRDKKGQEDPVKKLKESMDMFVKAYDLMSFHSSPRTTDGPDKIPVPLKERQMRSKLIPLKEAYNEAERQRLGSNNNNNKVNNK